MFVVWSRWEMKSATDLVCAVGPLGDELVHNHNNDGEGMIGQHVKMRARV